jgi:murein L,D-transpeptidase YafK
VTNGIYETASSQLRTLKHQGAIFLLPLLAFLAIPCGSSRAAENPQGPAGILGAIDSIVGDEVRGWCEKKKLAYPPSAVVLRIFKQERELEIWGKDETSKAMSLIRIVPICAMDFDPGPKTHQGDGKTPEGFYTLQPSYSSSNWWMWMDLSDGHIDERGKPGKGSCFKMCIDYPNSLDAARTRAVGFSDPGGKICMHGNCVSAGCASFANRDFLPVFAFAMHHNKAKYGPVQLHIFPFRFNRISDIDAMAQKYAPPDKYAVSNLLDFWRNLETGFGIFNSNPNPLTVRVRKDGYKFVKKSPP